LRAHYCQRPTCRSGLWLLGCDLGAAALKRAPAVVCISDMVSRVEEDSGRTAFSVLGTMVDLVQCLYHSHMALMGKVHRWAAGSLRVVVVVGVRNGSREMLRLACSFPSINKHSSCRFPKEEFVYSQSEPLVPSGIQSSHAKTAIP
jgi:hypothetical protein